jgi:hypothetical protein
LPPICIVHSAHIELCLCWVDYDRADGLPVSGVACPTPWIAVSFLRIEFVAGRKELYVFVLVPVFGRDVADRLCKENGKRRRTLPRVLDLLSGFNALLANLASGELSLR